MPGAALSVAYSRGWHVAVYSTIFIRCACRVYVLGLLALYFIAIGDRVHRTYTPYLSRLLIGYRHPLPQQAIYRAHAPLTSAGN